MWSPHEPKKTLLRTLRIHSIVTPTSSGNDLLPLLWAVQKRGVSIAFLPYVHRVDAAVKYAEHFNCSVVRFSSTKQSNNSAATCVVCSYEVAGNDFVVHGMLALLVQSWPDYFRELPVGMRVTGSSFQLFYTFDGLTMWPRVFTKKDCEWHNTKSIKFALSTLPRCWSATACTRTRSSAGAKMLETGASSVNWHALESRDGLKPFLHCFRKIEIMRNGSRAEFFGSRSGMAEPHHVTVICQGAPNKLKEDELREACKSLQDAGTAYDVLSTESGYLLVFTNFLVRIL